MHQSLHSAKQQAEIHSNNGGKQAGLFCGEESAGRELYLELEG